MDREKIFEHLLRRNLADILTPLVTMTGWRPRLNNAQRDFAQLSANFHQLGQYLTTLGTLKLFHKTFVFSEMERGNIFKRLTRRNLADILTPLVTMTRKWP